jgi:soluble lytic murein transglycosylase-like protein
MTPTKESRMKKKTKCLVLGTLLPLLVQAPTHTASGARNGSQNLEPLSAPLFRFAHVEDANEFDGKPQDYANFILETVQGSLPEKYRSQARRVAKALIDEANHYGFDPLLLTAVIRQESRFNPEIRGRHGEIGLMQIKPSTARWLAERSGGQVPTLEKLGDLLFDPVFNIRMGTAYLAHLKKKFKGRSQLYVSAYNMGPGNLNLHLKAQVEPRIYSDKVFAQYFALADELRVDDDASGDWQFASVD